MSYKYNSKNISGISSIGYCYERYLKVGKPGTQGYRFVEESIEYCKQELFMENEL